MKHRLRGVCLLPMALFIACDRSGSQPPTTTAPAPATVPAAVSPQPLETQAYSLPATLPSTEVAVVHSEPVLTDTQTAAVTQAATVNDAEFATQQAVSSVPAFHPLANAQVGEWAVFEALHGRQLRYQVVEAGAATAQIEVIVFDQGKALGQPAMREEMRDFDPLAAMARPRRAQRTAHAVIFDAAGRKWDAMLYEDRWEDEGISYERKTWISPQAPVFGTLRMELYGDGDLEARLELSAFGN